MRLAKLMTAVAACSLVAAPVLAAPAASKLSISQARASTDAEKSSELTGGFLIPLLAVVAIVGGIVIATDGDDEPDSA